MELFVNPADVATIKADAATVKAQTGASESSGTFSYLDAGGEQTIVEITPTTRKGMKGIWLRFNNLTQNGTVKVYYKIDGSNYDELTQYQYDFVVADAEDYIFIPFDCYITSDFKVTYTEAVDETAARDIVYQLIYQDLEE